MVQPKHTKTYQIHQNSNRRSQNLESKDFQNLFEDFACKLHVLRLCMAFGLPNLPTHLAERRRRKSQQTKMHGMLEVHGPNMTKSYNSHPCILSIHYLFSLQKPHRSMSKHVFSTSAHFRRRLPVQTANATRGSWPYY